MALYAGDNYDVIRPSAPLRGTTAQTWCSPSDAIVFLDESMSTLNDGWRMFAP